jgi:hypothetical protein
MRRMPASQSQMPAADQTRGESRGMQRGGAGHPPSAWNRRAAQRGSECSATLGRDCWEPEKSSLTRLACSRSNSRNFTSCTLHLTGCVGSRSQAAMVPPAPTPASQTKTRPDQTRPNRLPTSLSEGHEHPVMPQSARARPVLLAWGFASYRIALSFCPKRLPSRSQHAHGLHPPPEALVSMPPAGAPFLK